MFKFRFWIVVLFLTTTVYSPSLSLTLVSQDQRASIYSLSMRTCDRLTCSFDRLTEHVELKMKNVLNGERQVCRNIRLKTKIKTNSMGDRINGKNTANYNSLHLSWEMLQSNGYWIPNERNCTFHQKRMCVYVGMPCSTKFGKSEVSVPFCFKWDGHGQYRYNRNQTHFWRKREKERERKEFRSKHRISDFKTLKIRHQK